MAMPRQSHPAAADAAPAPNAASRRRARPIRSARPLQDVDLNRWLSGAYVIPGRDDEDEDGKASDEAGRPNRNRTDLPLRKRIRP